MLWLHGTFLQYYFIAAWDIAEKTELWRLWPYSGYVPDFSSVFGCIPPPLILSRTLCSLYQYAWPGLLELLATRERPNWIINSYSYSSICSYYNLHMPHACLHETCTRDNTMSVAYGDLLTYKWHLAISRSWGYGCFSIVRSMMLGEMVDC